MSLDLELQYLWKIWLANSKCRGIRFPHILHFAKCRTDFTAENLTIGRGDPSPGDTGPSPAAAAAAAVDMVGKTCTPLAMVGPVLHLDGGTRLAGRTTGTGSFSRARYTRCMA